MALSNTSGSIVETYTYDVFGTPTITLDGSTGNPYMFTGRRYDPETELYYYRARMYAPNLGRFLQSDPIGYDDGMNMYAYVANNPATFVDPWGLLKVHIWDYLGKDRAWGHASLTLDDGTHISWWPQGQGRRYLLGSWLPIYEVDPFGSQDFADDVMFEKRPPDWSLEITGLDEMAIRKWWDAYKTGNKWKTLSNNCATITYKALREGGAPPQWELIWQPEAAKKCAIKTKEKVEGKSCP